MPNLPPSIRPTSVHQLIQVLNMLKADHQRIRKALQEMDKKALDSDSLCYAARVTKVCTALNDHSAIEEEVFYVAIRDVIKSKSIVQQAEVEHAMLRALMDDLASLSVDNRRHRAIFTTIVEYARFHIEEEEKVLFRQLFSVERDWGPVLAQMEQRQAELAQKSARRFLTASMQTDEISLTSRH